MFRVEGVKGRTVRIDFEDAPVGKWWSLNPVYSYITAIATFPEMGLADYDYSIDAAP